MLVNAFLPLFCFAGRKDPGKNLQQAGKGYKIWVGTLNYHTFMEAVFLRNHFPVCQIRRFLAFQGGLCLSQMNKKLV